MLFDERGIPDTVEEPLMPLQGPSRLKHQGLLNWVMAEDVVLVAFVEAVDSAVWPREDSAGCDQAPSLGTVRRSRD